MAKKKSDGHKPKHHKKGSLSERKHHGSLEEQTINSLIELQRVHVNMAEKFDKLAVNIENLLALFELAARNFAKQPHMQNTERDKEFLDKIDKLLEQNKLLAKGLSLMEDKMRERLYGVSSSGNTPMRPSNFRDLSRMQPSTKLEEI